MTQEDLRSTIEAKIETRSHLNELPSSSLSELIHSNFLQSKIQDERVGKIELLVADIANHIALDDQITDRLEKQQIHYSVAIAVLGELVARIYTSTDKTSTNKTMVEQKTAKQQMEAVTLEKQERHEVLRVIRKRGSKIVKA